MRAFFEANFIEVLLVYGLSFVVLGVVIFVLPRQDARLRFVNHLPLIAAFGLIHGLLEFVILWKVLHRVESAAVEWLAALLLFGSFLPLLEFGRRVLWCEGPAGQAERSRLFTPWLYAALLLATFTTAHVANDALTGFVAGTRWFIGLPGALLTGLALLTAVQKEEAGFLDGTLRNYLRLAAAGFIAYALSTIVLSANDPALPALLPTQARFMDAFGMPVQAVRALCAAVIALALVHVVRRVNHENRLREIELMRRTEYANDLLSDEVEQRRRFEEELKVLAAAFDTQEAVVITDADSNILRVNEAFQGITGYSADEVVGKNPHILNSGQHDARFYQAMWDELQKRGKWSGEIWNRRKSGDIYPEWLTITAVKDKDGEVRHYVGTFTDITGRKQAEEEIRMLALYDSLTRLPNRRLLQDRLTLAFNASMRSRSFGAVVFIDLDNFKNINDTKGHETGDQLLVEVANRLVRGVRESDTVARVGGDEFVLILGDLDADAREAATMVEKIAEKVLAALRQPYRFADYEYHCSASMGITLFIDHELSVDELFRRADTAMYRAKGMGKDTWSFFDPAMQAALEARLAMESELRNAIVRKQLSLYY